ncbi:MAG TPA: aldose epimerase family protein [Telluria sp.]|nr:aldose epimerase family protein [Telluria sp.]
MRYAAAPVATLLLCCGALNVPAHAASFSVAEWGKTAAGERVQRVTMQNDTGMRVSLIDYGATITEISVPDKRGLRKNVVLSLPDVQAYERSARRWGGIVGRYAGRIANGRFQLDGKAVALDTDANGHTLHGGPRGYDRRVWRRTDFHDRQSQGVVFELLSPDGDQGFPGALQLRVRYRMPRKGNELRIEYEATSTAPTPVNFTNHAFYNLRGADSGDLGNQRFLIHADRYANTGDKRIPSGLLSALDGSELDFRSAALVMPRLGRANALLGDPPGIDHSLVFAGTGGGLRLVAEIVDLDSGRRMRVRTTEPGAQFNTGNGFDGSETGSEGIAYRKYGGFAFETQHLPDSPNHPPFPSTILRPGERFRSVTLLSFSVVRD